MVRPALLAPAVAVALAACSSQAPQSCPGQPVASLSPSLVGTLTPAPLPPLPDGFDPDPGFTDCAAAMGFPATISLGGTLASDAGSAGALCRSSGPIMFGTRTANRWVVEIDADGAVLGGCDPTCAAASRMVLSGDVLPDASAPASFQGAFVEVMSQTGGLCGACTLPCAARYVLTGTVVAP